MNWCIPYWPMPVKSFSLIYETTVVWCWFVVWSFSLFRDIGKITVFLIFNWELWSQSWIYRTGKKQTHSPLPIERIPREPRGYLTYWWNQTLLNLRYFGHLSAKSMTYIYQDFDLFLSPDIVECLSYACIMALRRRTKFG